MQLIEGRNPGLQRLVYVYSPWYPVFLVLDWCHGAVLANTACESTTMGLMVVETGPNLKGLFATKKPLLSEKMTKLEFVELLKVIGELDLFDRFLKSQRISFWRARAWLPSSPKWTSSESRSLRSS